MLLEIPTELEQRLATQAQAQGQDAQTFVLALLEQGTLTQEPAPNLSPRQQAVRQLRGMLEGDVANLIAMQRNAGHRLALGDVCGVALARRESADFYPADRSELTSVAAAGLCSVTFIR